MPVTYELRDYQHQWIKDIWNSWKNGNRRVLAQLPTAAGKCWSCKISWGF
ncbi:DEAD/DEAH box helicase family protein [Nostoc sp. UIC10630]|nr:DEAD/DEAH box helicase family protein [Nostoc sp. UIC 10630]